MPDFVVQEREYPQLPEMLLEEAPGFGDSEEFARLEASDRALPSVVCGAFTQYVQRLHEEAAGAPSASGERISETYRAMERLAGSRDAEVVNTLVVEVYEHLDLPDRSRKEFSARLGPASRSVYEKWIERTRGRPG